MFSDNCSTLQAFQLIDLSCSLPLYYYSAVSFGIIDDLETCSSAARYSMLAFDCQRGLIGDFIHLLQQLNAAVAFFFSCLFRLTVKYAVFTNNSYAVGLAAKLP